MISIIIPTYKPGPYLWECLESICAQTLNSKDWEVILILNGDKEPYWSEIRHWIADHAEGKQIHLLYEEKASVSQARNRGLDAMNAEYVKHFDKDHVPARICYGDVSLAGECKIEIAVIATKC